MMKSVDNGNDVLLVILEVKVLEIRCVRYSRIRRAD